MRLTVTCDSRRRGLRVHVEQALDYPPGHVTQLLAAATAQALTQRHTTAKVAEPAEVAEAAGMVSAPRPAAAHDESPTARGSALGQARLRRRVLAALDEGATVEQAARRFGVDPAVIDRWDDDAALDARVDLLAADGWPVRGEAC